MSSRRQACEAGSDYHNFSFHDGREFRARGVVALYPGRLFRLRVEMPLAGLARLETSVEALGDGTAGSKMDLPGGQS